MYIVILNWNGKKDTLECLDSLRHVKFSKFQIIVVDNGSSDDSVAAIRALHPEVFLIETGRNLGFAGGNNPGITWALSQGAEWILLLNNDTVVDPDFLNGFMAASQERPRAKILGAKIYRYGDRDCIDHLGGAWNRGKAEFDSLNSGERDDGVSFTEMRSVDYVCGAALLMHRTVPEAIGLLEPRFFLFWEETDFCSRAKRAGFEIWTAPQAKVWHKISASFTGGKPQMHYFWWRSRLLWIERNCLPSLRKEIYRRVIIPEIWKMARHFFVKRFASWMGGGAAAKQKALRCRAGLHGVFDYWKERFRFAVFRKRSF